MTTHICVHVHVCAADFPWGAYVSGPQLRLHSFPRVTHIDNGKRYKLRSSNAAQDILLWRDISLAETRGDLALQSEALEQWVEKSLRVCMYVCMYVLTPYVGILERALSAHSFICCTFFNATFNKWHIFTLSC